MVEELKPRSFRVSDRVAQKIKEIADSLGGNQQEVLSKLIEAYEFQSAKNVLLERKEDINQFEAYITALTRLYSSSLEENIEMKKTVRAEYDAQLKAKDELIAEFQQKVKDTEKIKAESQEALLRIEQMTENYENMKKRVQESLEKHAEAEKEGKEMEEKLRVANGENFQMQQEILRLQKELSDMEAAHKSAEKNMEILRETLDKSEAKTSVLMDKLNAMKDSVKEEKESAYRRGREEAELAMEKQLLIKEKEYTDTLKELSENHSREILQYQNKYMELLQHKTDEK